jgi:hypothetical protein
MTNISGSPDNGDFASAVIQWIEQIRLGKYDPTRIISARSEYDVLMRALTGRESPQSEALDPAADLDKAALEKAAAEQLKNDLTPERGAALLDLAVGKGDAKDIIDALRPVAYLLNIVPSPYTPRVQAIRELMLIANAGQKWDGFDGQYWTTAQMVLWAITGDRWAVDNASNDSGQRGELFGQDRAKAVFDALNVPRERIRQASDELWRQCLSGDVKALMRAPDLQWGDIPKTDWLNLDILLRMENTPCVVCRGKVFTEPRCENILFPREEAEKLRKFPPERRSEDPVTDKPGAPDRDESPNDLRDVLERAHDAYVDRNGKDEWDGSGEPCWTHAQTIIWRVTRNPGAVDKASADSGRQSLGDDYAKNLGAAVIEMLGINIGEVRDAARELRRLCLAGELTAYDRNGDAIDKMAWLPLEIVLDTENRLWITRNGQSVAGDVMFQRVDVLRVWPERPAAGDGVVDAYADVAKQYENEGSRRSELDRRAKQIEWIVQRLAKPAPQDRTHFRVSEIVERCVLDDDPAKRAAYFKAFGLAVKDSFFNEGKCYRSRLFCTDTAAPFFMWLDKKSLATNLGDENEIAAAARGREMDQAQYRARKLERFAERTWMPRRFIRAWLDGYGLPVPPSLEDKAPVALSTAPSETARTGTAQSLPSTQRGDEDTVPATVAPAGASTSEQFAASTPVTRVPLREYWISKGARFPPPNPPEGFQDYEQWRKNPERQAAAEADQRAWREICEEAAAGKISIEALQVAKCPRFKRGVRRQSATARNSSDFLGDWPQQTRACCAPGCARSCVLVARSRGAGRRLRSPPPSPGEPRDDRQSHD